LESLGLDKISLICQDLAQPIESDTLLINRPTSISSIQVNRFVKKGRGVGEFALSVKRAA
jgi:hypothetical protein